LTKYASSTSHPRDEHSGKFVKRDSTTGNKMAKSAGNKRVAYKLANAWSVSRIRQNEIHSGRDSLIPRDPAGK